MPKQRNVTDAEVISCHKSAEDLIADMHDCADRIAKGYVDRLENPVDYARQFSLIARAASSMVTALLLTERMQRERAELDALRKAVNE